MPAPSPACEQGDMTTPSPTRHRTPARAWLVLVAGALLGALALLLIGPRPLTLGAATGDRALAADVAAVLGNTPGYDKVSALRLKDGTSTWAGFGEVTPDTRFELGSITKTFDGLLLADAVKRGEVTLDAPVSAYLPELAGSAAGTATLAELASHRAGLSTISRYDALDLIVGEFAADMPAEYGKSPQILLADAATLKLSNRGTMQYSNLGASLLGLALARAAKAPDWPTYVRQRLLDPLGMTATRIGPAPDDLLQGYQPNGRPADPWVGAGGYTPAGLGITTTAADLGRYARAILDGTAPGLDALDPRWDTAGLGAPMKIGLAWITLPQRGWAWHNGGTGGFRTVLVLDRAHHTAVALLGNTSQDLTGAGLRLMGATGGPPLVQAGMVNSIYCVVGLIAPLLLAYAAVRARHRLKLVSRALWAIGGLAVWLTVAPWEFLPSWVFGIFAGLTVAALGLASVRWPGLDPRPEARRPLAITMAALAALWFVVSVGLGLLVLLRG